MKKSLHWVLAVYLVLLFVALSIPIPVHGADPVSRGMELTAKSAVLMEASTGRILYAHNPAEAMPPASVTKIMTLLLVMERIDEAR